MRACTHSSHVTVRRGSPNAISYASNPFSAPQSLAIIALLACRLGAVARKNGCPTVCKDLINTLYGYNAMEVQEAFNKICEQACTLSLLFVDLITLCWLRAADARAGGVAAQWHSVRCSSCVRLAGAAGHIICWAAAGAAGSSRVPLGAAFRLVLCKGRTLTL